MVNRIFALLKKDVLLELRQQHSFYGLMLYIASTIFVLYLSLNQQLSADVWTSMFWVIQLFVCVNTVAKSFLPRQWNFLLPSNFLTAYSSPL